MQRQIAFHCLQPQIAFECLQPEMTFEWLEAEIARPLRSRLPRQERAWRKERDQQVCGGRGGRGKQRAATGRPALHDSSHAVRMCVCVELRRLDVLPCLLPVEL